MSKLSSDGRLYTILLIVASAGEFTTLRILNLRR